ncbi:uncharacterized protein [Dermacentor andersoni]|uniref:uncharacterized protein n=1 Tax=Dermacentor andersoni TaxID=34620 RepID=UPI003B3B50E5
MAASNQIGQVEAFDETAVERALALEEAKKNVEEAHAKEAADELHKMGTEGETKRKRFFECYRCGSDSHFSRACPHIADKCTKCGKKGHIQPACRGPKQKPASSGKLVRTLQSDDTGNVQMLSQRTRHPITVEVEIQGVPLRMELDTGATVSVISRQQFKKLRPPSKLEPTALRLKTYTGEVQPCGGFNAAVRYKDQVGDLPLCVVYYGGPALLGREWLETFLLDWDEICGLHKLCNDSHADASQEDHGTRQRALLDKYNTIIDDILDKIEGLL